MQRTADNQRIGAQELDHQLYGRLLEVNAALRDAGGALIVLYALVLITAYMAIWFGWYRSLQFLNGADLNVIWTYLFGFVVVFFIWILHFEFAQWMCYRRRRAVLLDHVQRSGISRYELLALIAHDDSVATVAAALQRDRWDEEAYRYLVRVD